MTENIERGSQSETLKTFAVYEIFKILHEGESDISLARAEDYLNHIAYHGVSGTAELVWEHIEADKEPKPDADPKEVKEFLQWVHTVPPIGITDIGSVDEVFIRETRLTEDYVEELRELLAFVDADQDEISVLDIPKLREKMKSVGVEKLKSYLTLLVMDMHGIAHTFDRDDTEEWNKLRIFVETLSTDLYRDFSRHLRDRINGAEAKEKMPYRDVADMMGEIAAKQRKEIELAIGNIHSSEFDKKRLLEMMPKGMRERIESYIDEARELGDDELTHGTMLDE